MSVALNNQRSEADQAAASGAEVGDVLAGEALQAALGSSLASTRPLKPPRSRYRALLRAHNRPRMA